MREREEQGREGPERYRGGRGREGREGGWRAKEEKALLAHALERAAAAADMQARPREGRRECE